MAYKGISEDIKTCIKLGRPSRVPCFPISVMYDYLFFGFSHRQCREEPRGMYEIGMRAVEEFDYDIYMLHPDDLLEYDDTGIVIKFEEDLPPAVSGYLAPNQENLKKLRSLQPDPLKGRLKAYLEGLRLLKKGFSGHVLLVGRIAAPFTTLSLIFGIEETLILMIEKPDFIRNFMDLFLDYNDKVAEAQLAAGADAIWLGDCVSSSHFISADQYKEFAAPYAREAAERIKRRGGIVFYHNAEISIPHFNILSELGFSAVNVGYGVDIALIKNAVGRKVCLMGNLDTIKDLNSKSIQHVKEEVCRIVRIGKQDGGYIFCTGEGITHNTPKANIHAMMEAVRQCGSY
ncbi:MAG: uroporphyrinogen decarboxylase family protein [Kiritimatiellia bacterium]|nr:uroporphyrinogen decarboxylase family protein [Kiritimatiellia bacterium]